MPGAAAHTSRRHAPEKEVDRAVTRDLRALGCEVVNLSQARASKQTPGVPDKLALHAGWGLAVWVELKSAAGTTSPAQDAMHASLRAAGHHVVTARCTADVTRYLKALGAPIQ